MIATCQRELRGADHRTGLQFRCGDCQEIKDVPVGNGGTGYGYFSDADDSPPICYACCAIRERKALIDSGKGILYLSKRKTAPTRERGHYVATDWELTEWAGKLRFDVTGIRTGRHNFAGRTYTVTFRGPDGAIWRGIQYGDNTQICRVKRAK